MSGYWQGILTLPVLLIAGALVWQAWTLAHYVWRKLHEAMFERIKIRVILDAFGDTREAARNRAIDEFSENLKKTQDGMWLLRILGFQVLITKKSKGGGKA